MDDFDLDYDEALSAEDRLRVGAKRVDKQICSCGHATSRHRYDPNLNRHLCRPNAYKCPCLVLTPIMEVPNTRFFMKKSQGSGTKHALSQGYAASKEKLGEEFAEGVTWLIPQQCQFCQTETKYYPVRTNQSGDVLLDTDEDEGVTLFLCADCRDPLTHGKSARLTQAIT